MNTERKFFSSDELGVPNFIGASRYINARQNDLLKLKAALNAAVVKQDDKTVTTLIYGVVVDAAKDGHAIVLVDGRVGKIHATGIGLDIMFSSKEEFMAWILARFW